MNKRIIISGPTATGKTNFAVKLAKELNGEIINADSMQVYAENPIISAQPSIEEKQNIPHHLFGYVKGYETYTIARWIDDASSKINAISNIPILVGGTGFYIKHLVFGLSNIPEIPLQIKANLRTKLEELGPKEFYESFKAADPDSAAIINANNIQKILRAYEVIEATGRSIRYWHSNISRNFSPASFKLFVLIPDREIIYNNCNHRFIEMLNMNVIDEVKYLLKQGYNPYSGVMKSHGVPELTKYLNGEWTLDQAIIKSQQVVRNYAKRQITWFKHQFDDSELVPYFINNPEKEFRDVLEECRKFLG